jgi:hypothetical protein
MSARGSERRGDVAPFRAAVGLKALDADFSGRMEI